MRTEFTVRDVMTRGFLGVNESDPIRETASLLLAENATVVAVVRGAALRGMVTERQLLAALLDDERGPSDPIESCMSAHPPTLPPDAALAEAATVLADAEVAHLFVIADGELEGAVSENDVLTAMTARLATDTVDEQEDRQSAELGVEAETGAEAAELSAQSVCEVCGTLKSDLTNFNGQLVCSDCRSV